MNLSRWITASVCVCVAYASYCFGDEFAYVANFNSNNVTIIDATTNVVVGTVTVGHEPSAIVVTPNGQLVYVANSADNTVSVIDAFSRAVIATITVGANPEALAVTPDSTTVFVADHNDDTVYKIDTSSNTATLFANLPNGSMAAAAVFNGNQLYVSLPGSGQIEVFDTQGNTVAIINNGQMTFGLAAQHPNGGISSQTYAASGIAPGFVQVINGVTLVMDVTVGTAPDGIAVTPDGGVIYEANFGDNTVNVIETFTDTIIATIPVGVGPDGVAISPSGLFGYVANFTDNTISVLDTNSASGTYNTVLFTLPSGGGPSGVATGIAPGPSVPTFPTGKQLGNCFLDQTDLINVIQWNASTSGSPVQYNIYRDAALTDLAGTVPATQLKFKDHNRKKNQTYTYYIVAVTGSGGTSSAATITVAPNEDPCK